MHIMFGKEIRTADGCVIVPEIVTVTTIELLSLTVTHQEFFFALCHVLDDDRVLIIPVGNLRDYEKITRGLQQCDGIYDVQRRCELCRGRDDIEDSVIQFVDEARSEGRNARAF